MNARPNGSDNGPRTCDATWLCAHLAALGLASLGIGRALAVVGFGVRAMGLGHEFVSAALWRASFGVAGIHQSNTARNL